MGTLARHGRTEAVTRARAEAVWQIIADVTRVGEWSHECRGARLLGGARAAAPGVRFRGQNRSGVFRWSRSCVFTEVESPRALAWRTTGLWGRLDSTQWRLDLEPIPGGTRIVQTYQVLRVAPGLSRVYWWLIKAHRDRRAALADDLDRLAALAADDPEGPPLPGSDVASGTGSPARGADADSGHLVLRAGSDGVDDVGGE